MEGMAKLRGRQNYLVPSTTRLSSIFAFELKHDSCQNLHFLFKNHLFCFTHKTCSLFLLCLLYKVSLSETGGCDSRYAGRGV